MENISHKYDDIINLPHHVSKKHPQMSLHDRAAQFSPFAALTGHKAAINETAHLTDEKQILSEDVIAKLNEQLNLIKENIGTNQTVTITYFVPDDKKSGGAYISHTGVVKKIDEYNHTVILTDKTVIPIEQLAKCKAIFSAKYINDFAIYAMKSKSAVIQKLKIPCISI